MKKLDVYISELLYKSEKVVVPGFGAFIRQTARSLHDANSHSVRPPRAVIGFNPHLSKDDGQLIGYITQKERLSPEKVKQFVSGTVASWQESLRKSSEAKIERIGKVILSRNGQYRFVQQVGVNYNTDTFGMPSYVLKSVSSKGGGASTASSGAEKKVQMKQSRQTANKKQDNKTPILLYGIVIAVLIIGVLVAAYFFILPLDEPNQAQLSLTTISQEESVLESTDEGNSSSQEEETIAASEEVVEPTQDISSSQIEKQPQSLGENISKRSAVKRNHGNYALIIASTPSKVEAKRILGSLKDKGYESFIAGFTTKNGVRYFRIACSEFKTADDAKIFRSKIRGEYPDAWIKRLPKK